MKVGITLPTFERTAGPALAVARAADDAGIDGVFVFDHLWPIGTEVAAGAFDVPRARRRGGGDAGTSGSALSSRAIGLLPDELVADSLVSLQEIAGPRLVAALGIGDAKSVGENEAYGIEWPALEDRRMSLAAILAELTAQGIECWVGATAPETLEIARAAGATVNLWDVGLDRLGV